MGAEVRRIGERGMRWLVRDRACIGRLCFAPGVYQHRGATAKGSHNTGAESMCCLNSAHHGCGLRECPFDSYIQRLHRTEGWRNV